MKETQFRSACRFLSVMVDYCFISAMGQYPSNSSPSSSSPHALGFVSCARTGTHLDRKWRGWTWKNTGASGYEMSCKLQTARMNLRCISSRESTMIELKQRFPSEAGSRTAIRDYENRHDTTSVHHFPKTFRLFRLKPSVNSLFVAIVLL